MPTTNVTRKLPLPAAEVRAISVRAEVDPRTLAKFLLGQPVIHMAKMRIERALRAAGLARLLEQPEQPAIAAPAQGGEQ